MEKLFHVRVGRLSIIGMAPSSSLERMALFSFLERRVPETGKQKVQGSANSRIDSRRRTIELRSNSMRVFMEVIVIIVQVASE